MIIFTAAYEAAEEAAGRPMLNARIGWDTLTRTAAASDVTASSATIIGPSDSPLRPDTAEFWLPSSMPATWTLGWTGLESIDYVGIASHTLGTVGATVTVETNAEVFGGSPDTAWVALSQAYAPLDDKPLIFLDTPRAARQMRITLGGSPVPNTAQIGVIYVGLSLWMPEAIRGSHTPLVLSRETVMDRALSRGGQFLGQNIRRMGFTGSVAFEYLDADWYRTTFEPFVLAARRYPYFFAWRPAEREDEVAYVWTGEDISPAYMGFMDYMSVSWNMQGLSDEA